jgi:hypothetical protein
MELYGITVNEQAIAHGLYHEVMTEQDKQILSIGMINKPVLDCLERQLRHKFDEFCRRDFAATSEELDKELEGLGGSVVQSRDDFVRQVTSEVSKRLYGVAAEAGRMVV